GPERRHAPALRRGRQPAPSGRAPESRARRSRERLLSGPDRTGEPPVLRRAPRGARPGVPHHGAAALGGARRGGAPSGTRLLARHGAAAGAGTGAAARAGAAPPRRALQRARSLRQRPSPVAARGASAV